MGSGLHVSFDTLHPAHGKLIWLRVIYLLPIALFTLGFPTAPPHNGLSYATDIYSQAHSSIGTPSPKYHKDTRLRPFVGTRFQFYFTPLTGVLFTFPSRY